MRFSTVDIGFGVGFRLSTLHSVFGVHECSCAFVAVSDRSNVPIRSLVSGVRFKVGDCINGIAALAAWEEGFYSGTLIVPYTYSNVQSI